MRSTLGCWRAHIGGTHIDDALQPHEGAYGGYRHTMLPGTCLRDDAALSHPFGKQHTADGIVDLVRTRVAEVFALQIYVGVIMRGKTLGMIEGSGSPYVFAEQFFIFCNKFRIINIFQESLMQFLHIGMEYFGDICAAEITIVSVFVYWKAWICIHYIVGFIVYCLWFIV